MEFRHVTFSYEPGKPVLKDVSLMIEPGEMLGLAGHSGAGKSTFINLIGRFYDVDEGGILLDGTDVREVELKSLRDQMGVVLQDPFLFNGTAAENIAYGKPEAGLEEVVAAARAAHAHEFIMNLEKQSHVFFALFFADMAVNFLHSDFNNIRFRTLNRSIDGHALRLGANIGQWRFKPREITPAPEHCFGITLP